MKKLAILLSLGLVTLTGCGDDLIDRAFAIQAETLDYVCDCSVENGTSPDRASCERDNPELAPLTGAERDCYERVLEGTPSADIAAIECTFDASEALLACVQALSCMPAAASIETCNTQFGDAANACPEISNLTESMFDTCFGSDDRSDL